MKKVWNPQNILLRRRGGGVQCRLTSAATMKLVAPPTTAVMDRRHFRSAHGPEFNRPSMCSRSGLPVYQTPQPSQTSPFSSSAVTGVEGGRDQGSSISSSLQAMMIHHEPKDNLDNMEEDHQTLLDCVTAECQKIYDTTTLESALHTALQAVSLDTITGTTTTTTTTTTNHHNKRKMSPSEQIVLHEKIKHLEQAAERLLQATHQTIPLAHALSIQPPHEDRVRSLHRTFLSILGKCVSTLRDASNPSRHSHLLSTNHKDDNDTTTNNNTNNDNHLLIPSRIPSLVDKTLRLAVRARGDLGLPLHLPLFQGLALTAAQASAPSSSIGMAHSSISPPRRRRAPMTTPLFTATSTTGTMMTTTQWIGQLGTWAHEDFFGHHTKHDFYSGPLCVLAHRRCYEEVATLLGSILKKHPPTTVTTTTNTTSNSQGVDWTLNYLDERTLSYLFRIIHEDLKTHIWEPSSAADSPPQHNGNKNKYPTRKLHYRSTFLRRSNHHRTYHRYPPLNITSVTTVPAILEEILALLEPSVTKLFGELQDDDDDSKPHLRSTYMRDAIEILISPRRISNNLDDDDVNDEYGDEDDDDELLSSGPDHARSTLSPSSLPAGSQEVLHALFPEEFSEDGESMEFWEGEEDKNHEDEDDDHLFSAATWEFHVDLDSDLSVVSITRHRIPKDEAEDGEEEDDDDDNWSQHAPRAAKWHRLETVPDIVQQIEAASGLDLQYSKALQRDLLNQL